jgi:molecular chaperone DnaK
VYQQAGADGAPAGAAPGGNGNGTSSAADDVIDAEFTESK